MRHYRKKLDNNSACAWDLSSDSFTDQVNQERYYLRVTAFNVDEGSSGFSEAYLRNIHKLYRIITA